MRNNNNHASQHNLKIYFNILRAWLRYPKQFRNGQKYLCPICDYLGPFISIGNPPRWHGRCPSCGSRERHRLIHLYLQQRGIDLNEGLVILHFAPEKHFLKILQGNANYHTADIAPGKARHTMDMQKITFDDNSIDIILNNHVLEHVSDDRKAMGEIYRVLRPGGFALITVPINWSRQDTYENLSLTTAMQRFVHYGDRSHVRYYGRDFSDRLLGAGFQVECWRLPQEEEPGNALLRDDVLWVATKALMKP